MIKKYFQLLLKSRIGEKYLHMDIGDDYINTTEKGIRRIFFYHMLLFYGAMFAIVSVLFTLNPLRMVGMGVIISLYTTEKIIRPVIAVLTEIEGVTIERREFEDSKVYNKMVERLNEKQEDR